MNGALLYAIEICIVRRRVGLLKAIKVRGLPMNIHKCVCVYIFYVYKHVLYICIHSSI